MALQCESFSCEKFSSGKKVRLCLVFGSSFIFYLISALYPISTLYPLERPPWLIMRASVFARCLFTKVVSVVDIYVVEIDILQFIMSRSTILVRGFFQEIERQKTLSNQFYPVMTIFSGPKRVEEARAQLPKPCSAVYECQRHDHPLENSWTPKSSLCPSE